MGRRKVLEATHYYHGDLTVLEMFVQCGARAWGKLAVVREPQSALISTFPLQMGRIQFKNGLRRKKGPLLAYITEESRNSFSGTAGDPNGEIISLEISLHLLTTFFYLCSFTFRYYFQVI